MSQTDTIADFLTRIRNGQKAKHPTVEVPSSKMRVDLAGILKREGFIKSFQVEPKQPNPVLKIGLRYRPDTQPYIRLIQRISRPGCRVYATAEEIVERQNVVTTFIVTTSKGIMTDADACAANIGGELLCQIQ